MDGGQELARLVEFMGHPAPLGFLDLQELPGETRRRACPACTSV